MKKRLLLPTLFLAIFFLASNAFASVTDVTYLKFTLIKIEARHSNLGWQIIFGGSREIVYPSNTILTAEKNIATDGLPDGTYDGLRYTFSSTFEVNGYVELAGMTDPAHDGRYNLVGDSSPYSNGSRSFKKGAPSAPITITLPTGSYPGDFNVTVTSSEYICEDLSMPPIVIDSATGKQLNVFLHKSFLWSSNPNLAVFSQMGDFQATTPELDSGYVYSDFGDPPEIDWTE